MKPELKKRWNAASILAKILIPGVPILSFIIVVMLDVRFKTDVQAADDHAVLEQNLINVVNTLTQGQNNDRIDRFNREIRQIDDALLIGGLDPKIQKSKENRRKELVALIACVRAKTC